MLKKLQKRFNEITARLKEIRAMDELTDEIREERDKLLDEAKQVKVDIEKAVEMEELEARNNIPDPPAGGGGAGGTVTVEDQPVYRGTRAAALGQQIVDVCAVTDPNTARAERDVAQQRLEQATRRALYLIAKRQGGQVSEDFERRSMAPLQNAEARAAGTGQIQGVQSEGGFLLQSETAIDLVTHGFNNSVVLSRCQKRTLTGSESLEVVGIDETSRADGSRGGGVRVYTDAELSQITSSMTKFEMIKLAPERLTGMYYASDKILKNVVYLGQEMTQLFSEEFAFKTQDLVIEGTGAGQALGIKNADCMIEIDKESGQAAATIVTENILNMLSRFYVRGGDGAVCWLINRDCFTQLMTMSYDIGTGGELAKLFTPPRRPGETGSIWGYPVFNIEQAETLGTAGDISLCDFSQYLCVDYGDVNEASSIHFKFDYGQTTFRFIYYFDGQPRMVSAITPFKGTNTVGPFIRIAVRS